MKIPGIGWAVVGLLVFTTLASSGLAIRANRRVQSLAGELAQAQQRVVRASSTNPAPSLAPAAMPAVTKPEAPAIAVPETNAISALREQVRLLESRLWEKDVLIASLQAAASNQTPTARQGPRDRNDWLENLKNADPERYKEIQARREESRQRVQQSFAKKAAHFLNHDTSTMTKDEVREYEQMLSVLNETWELAEQLRSELPREERHALISTLRENVRTLTPLLEQEREREFYKLGQEFGYSPEESQQFVEYLNNIMDVTSMRPVFEAMGRGGMGGGRPEMNVPSGR